MLLREMALDDGVEGALGGGAAAGRGRGPIGFADRYVVLDSFQKLRTSAIDRGEFTWNFNVQAPGSADAVGVVDRVDSVISAHIEAFPFPQIPEVAYDLAIAPGGLLLSNNNNGAGAPLLVPFNFATGTGAYPPEFLVTDAAAPPVAVSTLSPWIFNPYTQAPFGGRITVQLRDVGVQSIAGRYGGARHHFELALEPLALDGGAGVGGGQRLEARPIRDAFIFTDPVQSIHGLTLVFRNPDIPIQFDPDVFYNVPVDTVAGPYLRFNFAGHKLVAGDRIFVDGLASTLAGLNAYVNRPEGHVAGGVNPAAPIVPGAAIPDPYFCLDPTIGGATLAAAIAAAPPVTVRVAKRRLRITLRFRCLVPRRTNFITGV